METLMKSHDVLESLKSLMRRKVCLKGILPDDRRRSTASQLGSLNLLDVPEFHQAFEETWGL